MSVSPATPEVIIDDVWSRTAPKYRNRAVVLLVANMMLFGALCCFMFWLRTGWAFPPTYDHYDDEFKTAFSFAGGNQVTAYDLLTRPISLKQVPLHAVVIGLLFATLAAIPILVTILYRLPAALPFCAMVGFLAVMPWLCANLLLASVIAHFARKRLKLRFAAAMLALIPIGIYLLASSRKYNVPADLLTTPFEQGLVVVPLLLSVVAACGLVASVLGVARIVNYRPGAITPLLALMFLAPMFLFMSAIGRDELHYRILELNYGPRSKTVFASMNAGPHIRRAAIQAWHRDPGAPSIEDLEDRVRAAWQSELEPLSELPPDALVTREWLSRCKVFAAQQYEVVSECDRFIESFHNSSYVRCALYIKGRALDMRVDHTLFRRDGQLQFYDDFPSENSRDTWHTLEAEFPDSPLAQIARYRLARLDARAGRVDDAIAWLRAVSRHAGRPVAQSDPQATPTEQLFGKERPEGGFFDQYKDVPAQAAEFQRLLEDNRDPLRGDAPLVAFLTCDPRHGAYHQNLAEILELFENHPGPLRIADNIHLELILAGSSTRARIERLQDMLEDWPDGDTRPRVLYELGHAHELLEDLTAARTWFDQLEREYPGSRYTALAQRRRFSP